MGAGGFGGTRQDQLAALGGQSSGIIRTGALYQDLVILGYTEADANWKAGLATEQQAARMWHVEEPGWRLSKIMDLQFGRLSV